MTTELPPAARKGSAERSVDCQEGQAQAFVGRSPSSSISSP